MTWFQFYFKIFVLDRFLIILQSEERDESENGWGEIEEETAREGVLEKSNVTSMNYFTIFLQIVIVGNFSLAFIQAYH